MRRIYNLMILSIPHLLPLADALSLANFQPLTSISIPASCQIQYGTQIPNCHADDFKGSADCSQSCQNGLLSVAKSINNACVGITVAPSTLLGVVMEGNILLGLCPGASPGSGSKTTSAAAAKSTTTTTQNSKSKSTSQKSTQSSSSTTPSSIPSQTSDPQTSATTVKPSTSAAAKTTTKATKSSASSTSKPAQSTQNAKPASGSSGGGSPFDIASSASLVNIQSAICTFGFVIWAVILIRL